MSIIPTKHVTLRDGTELELTAPSESDAADILQYFEKVRSETRFLLSCPADPIPSLEKEIKFIRGHNENPVAVLIVAKVGGRMVGLTGVEAGGKTRSRHCAELGISILLEFCDRGIGTIMMTEAIDWARTQTPIEKLSLTVYTNNPRAIHVYQKVGFEIEGTRPKHVRYEDGSYADVVMMGMWLGKA